MQRSLHGFMEWRNAGRRVAISLPLTLVVATLSGCASPVLMKNPANGQIAQCYSPTNAVRSYYDRDKCVEDYQKQGWVETQ